MTDLPLIKTNLMCNPVVCGKREMRNRFFFCINNYWDLVSPYCIDVRITSKNFTVIIPKISRASGINGSVD